MINIKYPWDNNNEHLSALVTRYYVASISGATSIVANILAKGSRRRLLTGREFARAMGFPENFVMDSKDTYAYKVLGNSVIVPLVVDIARSVADALLGNPPRELAQIPLF